MREQISKSIFDIQLNIFLDLLNSKITIWTKMIVKRIKNNFDINNVDKANRLINKQNQRQNDFQQFDVYDFQFLQHFWFFSNYISYQFQNSAYQNQKYQYQFFEKKQQQHFFCFVCDVIVSSIFANNFRKRVRFENSKSNFETATEKFNKRRKIQQSKQKTNLRCRWIRRKIISICRRFSKRTEKLIRLLR